MYPYIIELGKLTVNPMWVGLLVFFIIFLYSVWKLQRAKTKESKIFDIVFVSTIIAAIVNRIVVVVANYDSYMIQGWNLLPFREYFDEIQGNQVLWFVGLPWSALSLVPGQSAFVAIFFGLVVGLIIFFMNAKKFKKIYEVLDDVVISYAIAALPLLIAMHYAGAYVGREASGFMTFKYADEVSRYSLQLLQLLYFIGFLAIVYVLKYRKQVEKIGLFSAIFLLLHGLAELLIRYLAAGYDATILNTFDYYQLLCLILVLLGLFLLFSIWQEYGQTASLERKQAASAFRDVGQAGGKERFNMSFSKFRSNTNLSTNSFSRYATTLKRKFKSPKLPENETK